MKSLVSEPVLKIACSRHSVSKQCYDGTQSIDRDPLLFSSLFFAPLFTSEITIKQDFLLSDVYMYICNSVIISLGVGSLGDICVTLKANQFTVIFCVDYCF